MTSGPVVTRSLRMARLVVAAAVCVAPVASALLLAPDGLPAWPTLLAVALGLGARLAAPYATAPLLVALALGPLWQAGTAVVTGSPDIERLMPWLALLGGWLAWPAGAAWRVTGAWRTGIVTWALVLAVTWPVTALRELDFTLQTIGVATANGSFGMTPHLSAAYIALMAQAQLAGLLLFDWAWGAAPAERRRAWLALAPGVALACLLAMWQQLVDPAFLSAPPWSGLARAAGPFYDANAMGALAALVAAALAGPGLRPAAVPQWLWSTGWIALAVAGVAATGSRTGLAALAASGVVTALVALRPRARLAALAALVLLVGAGLAAARITPVPGEKQGGNAIGRLVGTVRRVVDGGAGEALWVAWRRDGYGPASLAIIADHPWVGVGPGAFGNVITDYAREALGLHLPPDNAQNWWRQQLAELGGLGAAAPFLCSVLILLAVLRSWRVSGPAAARTAPLVTLGLMAVVSPATQHPVLLALTGLLVAHGVTRNGDLEPAGTAAASRSGWVAWTLALACAVGLAVEGWTAFRPAQRAGRFTFLYYYGLSPAMDTPFGSGRWSAQRSVAVSPPHGSELVLHVVLPHDDLATAPVTVIVSDGYREVCRMVGRDHGKLECRMPVTPGHWPIVELHVSRPGPTVDGVEQTALVAARYEP